MGGAKHVTLECHMFYGQFAADRYLANKPEMLEPVRRHEMDELEFRISQKCLGTTMERVVVRHPSDWWQAFKERWFPRWMKRRWPVRMTIVEVEKAGLYPEIPWRGGHLTAVEYMDAFEYEEEVLV